eukprot:3326966-Pyramimonas_sp.AAC.1
MKARSPAPAVARAPGREGILTDGTSMGAVISGRKTYRGIVCPCEHSTDRRPMCPMRRPSRSPNFGRTPWVWSRGDRLGRRVDPTSHPPAE